MTLPYRSDKKERIIAGAISIFSRNGYAKARIAEVAVAAGIGKGTIYEYFQSKEDLFFATFEQLMSSTAAQLGLLVTSVSGSAADRLLAMADAMFEAWLPNLAHYGLVLEYWSATASSPIRDRFKAAFQKGYVEIRQVVAALIQDGLNSGEFKRSIDPQKIASALIGSWDALLLQAWLDPDFDARSASKAHMQVIIDGLTPSISR